MPKLQSETDRASGRSGAVYAFYRSILLLQQPGDEHVRRAAEHFLARRAGVVGRHEIRAQAGQQAPKPAEAVVGLAAIAGALLGGRPL